MKWSKKFFFGGSKRDDSINDWISQYISDTGIVIDIRVGLGLGPKTYSVCGDAFFTLKEAKVFAEKNNK